MMMMMIIMGLMILMVRAVVEWAKDGTNLLIARGSSFSSSCNRERTKRRR